MTINGPCGIDQRRGMICIGYGEMYVEREPMVDLTDLGDFMNLEDLGEVALLIVIAGIVFGIRAMVLHRLNRWKDQSPVLARDVEALRRPSFIWATLVVLGNAAKMAPLPLRIANMLQDTVHVLLIL